MADDLLQTFSADNADITEEFQNRSAFIRGHPRNPRKSFCFLNPSANNQTHSPVFSPTAFFCGYLFRTHSRAFA